MKIQYVQPGKTNQNASIYNVASGVNEKVGVVIPIHHAFFRFVICEVPIRSPRVLVLCSEITGVLVFWRNLWGESVIICHWECIRF